jgi:hypothetical protein
MLPMLYTNTQMYAIGMLCYFGLSLFSSWLIVMTSKLFDADPSVSREDDVP